jgi:hypothetical protein
MWQTHDIKQILYWAITYVKMVLRELSAEVYAP